MHTHTHTHTDRLMILRVPQSLALTILARVSSPSQKRGLFKRGFSCECKICTMALDGIAKSDDSGGKLQPRNWVPSVRVCVCALASFRQLPAGVVTQTPLTARYFRTVTANSNRCTPERNRSADRVRWNELAAARKKNRRNKTKLLINLRNIPYKRRQKKMLYIRRIM